MWALWMDIVLWAQGQVDLAGTQAPPHIIKLQFGRLNEKL
jgi:hypothetical protein